MTHPLAGRTCAVVGGEAIGVRGTVIDGYAGLLGTPVGLGHNRVGPTSEMVYVIVFEVTHIPDNLPRDYIGHLFSVRATQVKIDPAHPDWAYKTPPGMHDLDAGEGARSVMVPTFNHTRGDGPESPCPECLKAMTRTQLIEYIQDLEQQLKDEMT